MVLRPNIDIPTDPLLRPIIEKIRDYLHVLATEISALQTEDEYSLQGGLYRPLQAIHVFPATSLVNSTTETGLISFNLPPGILETDREIHFPIRGGYSNNTGANRTFVLKVYLNGNVVYQDTSASLASSANSRPFFGFFHFYNMGAVNDNRLKIMWNLSSAGGATTGSGDLATSGTPAVPDANAMSIDTTAKVDITISITHSNNDTSWFQDGGAVILV